MKRIVDDIDKADEDKAAAKPLFQWRMLRRIARLDLALYAQAVAYSGPHQLEYAACKLCPDEERAKVCVRFSAAFFSFDSAVCQCLHTAQLLPAGSSSVYLCRVHHFALCANPGSCAEALGLTARSQEGEEQRQVQGWARHNACPE